MLTDGLSLGRQDRPGFGSHVLRQKFAKRSFTDETDSGAVCLVVIGKSVLSGQGPDLALLQVSERKERAGKCLALHRMQEVGLILVGVCRLVYRRPCRPDVRRGRNVRWRCNSAPRRCA